MLVDSAPSDADLLRAHYAGDVDAFTALVTRHLDWTYAVARRRTGDGHTAEDVVQATFLALARRGPRGRETTMTPWLFVVVRNLSAKAVRSARRRRWHEASAARPAAWDPQQGDVAGAVLAAALDELIAALPRADAKAVLLRYYERRSFADVAVAIGGTEAAARKRVGRSVARLREQFARRGFSLETTTDATLMAGVVAPAPVHLTAIISQRAAAGQTGLTLVKPAVAVAGAFGLTAVLAVAAAIYFLPPRAPAPASTGTPLATVTAAGATTRPTSLRLDDVIAALRMSEGRVTSLEYQNFKTTVSTGPTPQGPWTPSPLGAAGNAWFDGRIGGKARIDYTNDTSQWTGGAAPFYVEQHSASWDGQLGRLVRFTEGGINNVHASRVAKDSDKRPTLLDFLGYTGAAFVPNYRSLWQDNREHSLAESLAIAHRRSYAFRYATPAPALAVETIDGMEALRVRLEGDVTVETIWLVPASGYAIIRYEIDIRPKRRPPFARGFRVTYMERMTVDRLAEAGPGVWVPSDVTTVRTRIGAESPEVAYEKQIFHADAVVANDPMFDDGVYQVPIPAGFRETR